MPESLLSIHDQVEADTISGSSHGHQEQRPQRARTAGTCWAKNTASARPIANWNSDRDER